MKNVTSEIMFCLIFNIKITIFQELVKYSLRLGENATNLQKALELMLSVPHRAIDNKFITSIEGYKGK